MTSAMPDRAPRGRRLAHLDGIRAAAALFVLFHHAFCMAFPILLGVRPDGWVGVLFGWALFGHFGVTIFIVLAGYSLALGVANRSGELPGEAVEFMRRRAWRIVPPYWAALLMTILLVLTLIGEPTGTHWDQSLPTSPIGWLADALLLQDVAPGRDAAYPFWSIAVEWHIYLLLPIMLLARRRTESWRKAILFGAALGLAGILAALVIPKIGFLFPEYYLLFALAVGACVAVRTRRAELARVPWLSFAVVGGALVVVLGIAQPYRWMTANYYWIDILLGCAVISLLLHLAVRPSRRLTAALGWPPLAGVGLFSYSIYLVHAPLLAVFWKFVIQPLDLSRNGQLAVGWIFGVPLIVGFAYGFYRIFEKPFVGRSRRAEAFHGSDVTT